MRLATIIIASLITLSAIAQGPDRKPAPVEKRDRVIAVARKQYLNTVVQAEKQCISELSAAILTAGKSGNSDKVTSLAEAKKAAEQRFEAAKGEVEGGDTVHGVWHIQYSNGAVREYTISGSQLTFEECSVPIQTTPYGIEVSFPDGKFERVAFAGNRVYLEHFMQKPTFQEAVSGIVGIGVRR